jgi:hypothetical protein
LINPKKSLHKVKPKIGGSKSGANAILDNFTSEDRRHHFGLLYFIRQACSTNPHTHSPTMSDEAWITIELTDRQLIDGALLILYLLAIQIHSLLGWRKVYRVQRFSERNQRVYVVFSLRKVFRLIKEIILDHMVFCACLLLWVNGIMASALSENDIALMEDAALGDGELEMAKIIFV